MAKRAEQTKSSARGEGDRRPVQEILKRLDKEYPGATTALRYSNPLELLVATILSAQCTDERVNQVTETLFSKYRTAADYARASQEELEEEIKSTGFFRNKAKMIRECCQILAEKYGGQVPKDIDVLTQLPGIGRKTANVVLGTAYGIPTGVVVDTHVERVSRRLGLTQQKDRDKIEQDLMRLVPQKKWILFGHQLIHHGRRVCTARKPKCDACVLEDLCPKIGVKT
ncbi:MAG: endonuclease III [Thermoguttaceae bacterium]|nr:endonuclease III [Thermoguttaceae bacterium]MDW8078080.1 endonuclease III [Thermoguttaceae bacterium]